MHTRLLVFGLLCFPVVSAFLNQHHALCLTVTHKGSPCMYRASDQILWMTWMTKVNLSGIKIRRCNPQGIPSKSMTFLCGALNTTSYQWTLFRHWNVYNLLNLFAVRRRDVASDYTHSSDHQDRIMSGSHYIHNSKSPHSPLVTIGNYCCCISNKRQKVSCAC